ncbi:hypothetical protein HRbin11_00412 [bacterium HR11]|nr:hypothetical protein HRbin11_00412 [bacterium HR11]
MAVPVHPEIRERVVRLPEGPVTVLQDQDPMMVLVEQRRLVERANPAFWSPRWEPLYETLNRSPFPVRPLGGFIPETVERFGQEVPGITYGQVGRREYPPQGTRVKRQRDGIWLRLPNGSQVRGVAYYQVRNLRRTGLDLWETPPQRRFIAEGSYNDLPRSRLQAGDIVIVNSGVGSLGRCAVVPADIGLANISQDIDRIVVENVTPEWVVVFIQSRYGAGQLERWLAGVSGQVKIDFAEIRALRIPVPAHKVQTAVAAAYRQMAHYHSQAVAARDRGDETTAARWTSIALGLLETLILQVEELIERQRRAITPLIPTGLPEALQKFLEDEYERIGRLARTNGPVRPTEENGMRLLGIPSERLPEVREEAQRVLRLVDSLRGVKVAAD